MREPLNGVECVVPVTDRNFKSWLCSPRTLVENLTFALTMSTEKLQRHVRQVNLPGICVSVQEMRDALERVGGRDRLRFLKERNDEEILPILLSWPARFDVSRAVELGFKGDRSFEHAVRDFKESL